MQQSEIRKIKAVLVSLQMELLEKERQILFPNIPENIFVSLHNTINTTMPINGKNSEHKQTLRMLKKIIRDKILSEVDRWFTLKSNDPNNIKKLSDEDYISAVSGILVLPLTQ